MSAWVDGEAMRAGCCGHGHPWGKPCATQVWESGGQDAVEMNMSVI